MATTTDKKGSWRIFLFAMCIFLGAIWLGGNAARVWRNTAGDISDIRHPSKPIGPLEDPDIVHEPNSTNWFTLDQTRWQGVSCFDSSKAIIGHMLTRGVTWQVRCDHNDDIVITMFPANWITNPPVKLPSANSYEWRIQPGEPITTGVFCACIVDKKLLLAEHQELIKPIYPINRVD